MSIEGQSLPPTVMRALAKEVRSLISNPPAGITVSLDNDNIMVVIADIDGPEDTPFEGGLFRCRLHLIDYPASPPKGVFLTKIFHPNVSNNGDICVSVLKKDWTSTMGLKHLLTVIRCLLIHPNPESALNEDAGKLLLEQYEEYYKRARLMTDVHAKKKQLTVPIVITPASENATNVNSHVMSNLSNINNITTNNTHTIATLLQKPLVSIPKKDENNVNNCSPITTTLKDPNVHRISSGNSLLAGAPPFRAVIVRNNVLIPPKPHRVLGVPRPIPTAVTSKRTIKRL